MPNPLKPHATKPWYREPWPWILIALPASAVVAGLVTLAIAVKHQDSLVAEDYYKRGLAINQVLARESRAGELGLSARLSLRDGLARVELSGADAPPLLVVRFVHPTRAGEDRELLLAKVSGGWYQAKAPALAGSRWHVQLEDAEGHWRLSSRRWRVGEPLTLEALPAAGANAS